MGTSPEWGDAPCPRYCCRCRNGVSWEFLPWHRLTTILCPSCKPTFSARKRSGSFSCFDAKVAIDDVGQPRQGNLAISPFRLDESASRRGWHWNRFPIPVSILGLRRATVDAAARDMRDLIHFFAFGNMNRSENCTTTKDEWYIESCQSQIGTGTENWA